MKALLHLALILITPMAMAADRNPAQTQEAQDIAQIKTTLPAGLELAGAYVQNYDERTQTFTYQLLTGDAYLKAVAQSYVIADLNGDGLPDLAVATEMAPLKDQFGDRSLKIYFAAGAAGDWKLFFEGNKVILSADSGGVFGDPFDGVTLTKTGALYVSHYGGDADRSAIGQTFQYRRDGQMDLIGQTNTAYNDHTLIGVTVDTDLLTGNQIVTRMNGKRKDTVTHGHVAVKPLVRLEDAVAMPD